jgi:hypothetical protein
MNSRNLGLHHLTEIADESVAAFGHRFDVLVFSALIPQRFSKYRDENREVPLLYEALAPYRLHQFRFFDKMTPPSNEDKESVESLCSYMNGVTVAQ